MQTLTFHGANRVLERGISVDAIKVIADQTDMLEKVRNVIAPALTSKKLLKFRYLGRQFTASPGRIQMVLDVGATSFVVGMNAGASHPVIVTCWQN
jgi:hypothetical protein